jgi:cation transport regulator ChaC
MKIAYFAYGSNLCIEQMIARTRATGTTDLCPRVAVLADHRLVFQRITRLGSAFANVVAPGDGVEGVIYHCTPAQLERLDRFESGYERHSINVTDCNRRVVPVTTYVMRPNAVAVYGPPTAEYLDRIITGARQQGISDDYVRRIMAIAATGS